MKIEFGEFLSVIEHNFVDAESSSHHTLKVEFDKHGMTIALPNGDCIVLDISGGQLSVYVDSAESEMLKMFQHRIA